VDKTFEASPKGGVERMIMRATVLVDSNGGLNA
jgi:hypothetical protein